MSNNINPSQIKQMATEIANLLESKEENFATRGNNQIEASIWNKFVGQGKSPEEQVGNGEKSTIKHSIDINDAINSISSYIQNKGVDLLVKTLANIGIDWSADNVVNGSNKKDSTAFEQLQGINLDFEKIKKQSETRNAEAQAKFEHIEEQKNTVKATNGMTYNEIMSKIGEFKSRNWGGVVYDEKTGKPRFPNLDEIIASLEIKARNGVEDAKEHLNYIKELLNAKAELEAKYPDFTQNDYFIIEKQDGEKVFVETIDAKLKDEKINKKIAEKNAKVKAKYDDVENLKDTVKAGNGMTYNEIKEKIGEFVGKNWGSVITDKETGRPRFPNLDEIIEKLESGVKNNVPNAEKDLKYIKELLKAKAELEAKYPDFTQNDYFIIEKQDGEKVFVEMPPNLLLE